ncbi:helix-turn-helix domain-containing protein [Nocardia sp. JMUB6875]|uniref:PucR family transcriptional regulator n=1 Tax=Nocardia sp. JMUB6875 TaxID=3158170 RepID=UPI0032E5B5D5
MVRESQPSPATVLETKWVRLADRLAQGTNALVSATLDEARRQLATYRALPEEAMAGDIKRVTRKNIELLIVMIRSGELPEPAAFAEIEESARNRAEERLPLADIVAAYHVAGQVWWQAITDAAAATGDEASLVQIGVLVHRYLREAVAAVLRGYGADEAPLPAADHDRKMLYQALVAGTDPAATAQRFGLALATTYWVIAIRVQAELAASGEVATTVAARRAARRLERELDRAGRGTTLRTVIHSGGVALIPITDPFEDGRELPIEECFAKLERELLAVQRGVGAPVLFAVDRAAVEDIPVAVVEVQDLLSVAQYGQRSSGVLRFRDLAVEYQLSRPTRVTRLQRNLLSPLDIDPVLRETLEAYIWHQCNANAAAAVLHVHSNTVLNRLRKIADLLDLDLNRPRDLMRIFAAIMAANFGPDPAASQRDIYFD